MRKRRRRRNTKELLLDICIACRQPVTPTQLMYAIETSFTSTNKYSKKAIESGLIEMHEVFVIGGKESRSYKRKMGEFPWGSVKRGSKWLKVTKKGNLYIKNMRKIWEENNFDVEFKGILSFNLDDQRTYFMRPKHNLNKKTDNSNPIS